MKTLLLFLCAIGIALAADVSGKWQFQVTFDNGGQSGAPVLTFKQAGSTLTGTYDGPLGKYPATGEIKDQDIKITVKGERDGSPVIVVYTGKIESASKMSGRVSFNGEDAAKWTAAKQ